MSTKTATRRRPLVSRRDGTGGRAARSGNDNVSSEAAAHCESGLNHRGVRGANHARTKEDIRQLHVLDATPTLKFYVDTVAFLSLSAAAVLLWNTPWWPLTFALWVFGGHFGHTKPLAFHDAAHGTLDPRRGWNDAFGLFVGTVIFVPLTVYRYGHALHHNYISSRRDPEMWPFVVPGTPRALRVSAAVLELLLGFLYTPMLFLRFALLGKDIPRKARLRILGEYALSISFWSVILTVVHWNGWWQAFLVGYGAPVAVAGMFQSLNKYTEHMGLMGDTILSNTRTVADARPVGRWLSYSLQNVVHHGTHHRYAKIPYYHLPAATPYVFSHDAGTTSEKESPGPLFPNYRSALLDMLKTLGDPKAGSQWVRFQAKIPGERGASAS